MFPHCSYSHGLCYTGCYQSFLSDIFQNGIDQLLRVSGHSFWERNPCSRCCFICSSGELLSLLIFLNRQIATFIYTYVGIWYNFNNALILIFSDVFLHSRCCLGASHCPLQGNRFGHKNCSRLNICCVCFLLIARWHESSGHC